MSVKYKDIDLENVEHLKLLINEIEDFKNNQRKYEAWKAYQVFSGEQKKFVEKLLVEKYPKTSANFRVGDINITSRVINKRSMAYKHMPIRILGDELEQPSDKRKESELYNDLLKDNKANRAFKAFDEIFNLHKYALMWVRFINPEDDADKKDKGRHVFTALAPYEYDLFRDDITGDPIIFGLNFSIKDASGKMTEDDYRTKSKLKGGKTIEPNRETKKKYSFWNAKQHVQCEADLSISDDVKCNTVVVLKIKGNEENVNPIERLPIGFVSTDTSTTYPVQNPLPEQALNWNLEYSDLKTASVCQGHGQLVIEHPEKQDIDDKQHLGMHRVLDLPQVENAEKPTKAYYINANPDLMSQLSVLKFDAIQILEDHGVKAKGTIEGGVDNFSSGFDRLLAQADALDILEANQSLYADNLEVDVYEIVKAIDDSLNKKNFKSDSIQIIYEKPKVLISDKETLDNIEKRERIGVMLPYEKHITLNPNLTIEQAKEREEEIQKVKDEAFEKQQKILGEQAPPKKGDDEQGASKIFSK